MANKDFTLTEREFNGFAISQREDGFLDATAIAKSCSKLFKDWLRLHSTFELFEALAEEIGAKSKKGVTPLSYHTRISATEYAKAYPEMLQVKRGSPENGGGSWLHPELAICFSQWCDVRFGLKVSRWVRELLTQGSVVSTDFDSNLGVSLGRQLRVTKKHCPWERLYEKEMCDKIKKWYGFDSSKFYWWYVYNFLTQQERAELEMHNPVLRVISKSGKERTARKRKIHQHFTQETRERLTKFAEYLGLCIKFSSSRVEFEKKWALEYGLPTQLEIFDLWEFAS